MAEPETPLAMLKQVLGEWQRTMPNQEEFSTEPIGEGICVSYFPATHKHPVRQILGHHLPFVLLHNDKDGTLNFESTQVLQQLAHTTHPRPQLVETEEDAVLQSRLDLLCCTSKTTGIPLAMARLAASAVTQLCREDSGMVLPWVIQCNHTRFAFFCVQPSNPDKGSTTVAHIFTVTHRGSVEVAGLPQLPQLLEEYGTLRFADDNTSVGVKPSAHIAAVYDILGTASAATAGGGSSDTASKESWLHVEFAWEAVCRTLSAPPHACPVILRFQAFPDPKGSTSCFHHEASSLARLCKVVEHLHTVDDIDVETAWEEVHAQERPSLDDDDFEYKLEDFLNANGDNGAGDMTLAGGSTIPHTMSSSSSAATGAGSDARPLFSERRDLDLPDRVWRFVKDCSSFQQLRQGLVAIFQAMRRGEVKGSVHPGNQTQMAQLVIACEKANRLAARTTAEDKQELSALLASMATDPAALLACVMEAGVVKLQRDLLENVLGLKLATERQLAPLLKCHDLPLDVQLDRLLVVLRAMDAAALLRKSLDLPTAALSDVLSAMLNHRDDNSDEDTGMTVPQLQHALPEFSAGAALLRKVCSGLEPSTWTAKLTHPACPSRTYQFINSASQTTYLPSEDDAELDEDDSLLNADSVHTKYHVVTALESHVA